MPSDENANQILRWFDALTQGDLSLLESLAEALFTEDFCWHDPRMSDLEPGPAGVKKFIHQVLAENMNIRVTVHDIFSTADKTAYRFTVSMTVTASGEPVNIQLIAIDRFVGNRIAEEWQLSAAGVW